MSEKDGIVEERREDVVDEAKLVVEEIAKQCVRDSENTPKYLEILFRLNEQTTSSAEKIILLDVGTITLSLTFIGSLISRSGHVPRAPFLWLVCPAWFLLLVSIFSAWTCVAVTHSVNRANYRSCMANIRFLSQGQIGIMLRRLAVAVDHAIVKPVTNKELQEHQQRLDDVIRQTEECGALLKKQHETAAQEVEGPVGALTLYSRAASFSTIIGVVFLCLFAVEVVLSL